MYGIKHTVRCRCILSQFRSRPDPPLHEFVVFSVVEEDKVQKSLVKCNNCAITHRITDLCCSEILKKSDDWEVVKKSDIRISFSEDLRGLLDSYDADLPTWQMTQWIIENSRWGDRIILFKKDLKDRIEGKILVFKGPDQYGVETFLEEKNEL